MSEREHGAESYGAELSMPQIGELPGRPRTRISRKRNRRRRRHHHRRPAAAAPPPRRPEPVGMRRARVFGDVFGDPSRRDKEHHRASRKCRRESTVQSPDPNSRKRTRINFTKKKRRRRSAAAASTRRLERVALLTTAGEPAG